MPFRRAVGRFRPRPASLPRVDCRAMRSELGLARVRANEPAADATVGRRSGHTLDRLSLTVFEEDISMSSLRHPIVTITLVGTLIVSAISQVSAAEIRSLNALFDTVLAAHVNNGYVDYPEIARNVRFHKYVEALADVDIDTLGGDAEQHAFWLNVYNALVIKNIIDGIRPLGTLDRVKFFRTTEHRVGGREYDLKAIERRLLEFGDPRTRFAMILPAYSGPDLPSTVFRSEELDAQLDRAARQFIGDNRKNRFSDALRIARLNQVFEWNADEFGDDDQAVMAYLAPYVSDEVVSKALAAGRYKIEYTKFEWSINGTPMELPED